MLMVQFLCTYTYFYMYINRKLLIDRFLVFIGIHKCYMFHMTRWNIFNATVRTGKFFLFLCETCVKY